MSQTPIKIFLFLLIVVLLELGYYFFNNSPGYDLTQDKVKKQQLLDFIPIIKKGPLSSINVCSLISICGEQTNTENIWKLSNFSSPVPIQKTFGIKITLKNKKNLTGLNLYANDNTKENSGNKQKSIFIGLINEGKNLHVEAHSDISEQIFNLADMAFTKPLSTLYLIFYERGKYVLIVDNSFKPITYLNINNLTGNKFPKGIFREKKLFLGFGLAPQSNFSILEFIIFKI